MSKENVKTKTRDASQNIASGSVSSSDCIEKNPLVTIRNHTSQQRNEEMDYIETAVAASSVHSKREERDAQRNGNYSIDDLVRAEPENITIRQASNVTAKQNMATGTTDESQDSLVVDPGRSGPLQSMLSDPEQIKVVRVDDGGKNVAVSPAQP